MVKRLAIMALLLALVGCSKQPKHMGNVQFVFKKNYECEWFMRPNKDLIEACFDNPPPFVINTVFADVVYTDDNKNMRHFISARLP